MKNENKVDWSIFNQDKEIWFDLIKDYPESTFLNDIEWATHLENFGWKTLRLIKFSKNYKDSKTYIQAFFKFLPLSTAVIWVPGGIIGDLKNINGLQYKIKKILKVRFCIIRIRFQEEYNFEREIELFKNNWERPLLPLSSRFRILLKLNKSIEILNSKFSRNWKRSLKKSMNNNLKIFPIKNHKVISRIYNKMKKEKGLKKKFIYSPEVCKSIMNAYGEKLKVLAAKDKKGRVCSIRGVIIRGEKFHDIFAATDNFGRSECASHKVLFSIIQDAKDQGCLEYDLSNVDPEKSLGVYNFKKGVGGSVIFTLGEFEWQNSIFLKILFNIYCKIK